MDLANDAGVGRAGVGVTGLGVAGVVGVAGGSGGVGASTLAAVLATTAARRSGRCLLVDLDPSAGGVELLLGIEQQPGARWSDLRLGGGHLDPHTLIDGLPTTRSGCAVLSASGAPIDPDAVHQVVLTAAPIGPVVLDLPRAPGPARDAATELCRLVVVLARGDVPGLVGARTVAGALAAPVGTVVGLVVRRGEVGAGPAAELVGLPLLGELPAAGTPAPGLDPERPPAALAALARGVLAGLPTARRHGERWARPGAPGRPAHHPGRKLVRAER